MKRIGLHAYIRRYKQQFGCSPFAVPESDRWNFYSLGPISHLISDAAQRLFRSRKNSTIAEWNAFVEKAAHHFSGNPRSTLRMLEIPCRDRNKNKPIEIDPRCHGASAKRWWWNLHSNESDIRLKRFKQRKSELEQEEKEFRRRHCGECGTTSSGSGFMAVQLRWDVYQYLYGDEFRQFRKSGTPMTPEEVKDEKSILCVKCWNRITPMIRKRREAQHIQSQIRNIKKELNNDRKEHHRKDPGLPRRSP